MNQKKFVTEATQNVKNISGAMGLAVGGSWLSNELDKYSDVDLILVTREKISGDTTKMLDVASKLGILLNGFTGEHVGEPRVLICMYDNPLLHVDIKFLTADEFQERVEDPHVLWERDGLLTRIIEATNSKWPETDYQWIEDRFWTWVHYAALKIGRGEYFEALDFLSFVRTFVTSPLLQIKNGQQPRGLRKVEFNLEKNDLEKLAETVAEYEVVSIIASLEKTVQLYADLRKNLYPESIILNKQLEEKVLEYLRTIKENVLN